MSPEQPQEHPPLERAEALITRLEDETTRVARAAWARTLELAEDVWAEAQSIRKKPPER